MKLFLLFWVYSTILPFLWYELDVLLWGQNIVFSLGDELPPPPLVAV